MELRYTNDFDTLVALITHLSNVPYISRRPSKIADDLALDLQEVIRVLESFPAFFRKSRDTDDVGEHYYAIHIRYARGKGGMREEAAAEPLAPEELAAMVDVVTHFVAQEQETSRLDRMLQGKYRGLLLTNVLTLVAALVAAVAAIVAAMIESGT